MAKARVTKAKKKAAKKKATKKAKKPARAAKAAARKRPAAKRPAKKPGKKSRPAAKAKRAVAAPPSVNAFLGMRSQHVDFLTYKADQVKKFYGEILGFPTEQKDSGLNYLFVQTSPTSSLGFMPPHPQMAGEQPPPREPTLYFLVDDVDQVYAKLIAKGVAFMGPPQEMPWGDRVITTTDPEGRTVMFATPVAKG